MATLLEQPRTLATERDWRELAAALRQLGQHSSAASADFRADLRAIASLDLTDLFAPTPGDALALRVVPLAEGEAWRKLAAQEARFAGAERAAAHIAADGRRDPESEDIERAAYILSAVGRLRAEAWARAEAGAA